MFQECYDLKTAQPTSWYEDMFGEVKKRWRLWESTSFIDVYKISVTPRGNRVVTIIGRRVSV
jgi:hypothetical protein